MEVGRRSLRIFCLRISHPRRGNYCVCDGECVHTPCRTHIFLTHFPCVAYRHRVHARLQVSVRTSSLHLTFFTCFIRLPCCSRTVTSRHLPTLTSAPSLPNCSRSESAGQTHFRTSGEEFGNLADPTHSTEDEEHIIWRCPRCETLRLEKPAPCNRDRMTPNLSPGQAWGRVHVHNRSAATACQTMSCQT